MKILRIVIEISLALSFARFLIIFSISSLLQGDMNILHDTLLLKKFLNSSPFRLTAPAGLEGLSFTFSFLEMEEKNMYAKQTSNLV